MKNTTLIQSYEGEQIYVGIDVHKKSYVLVARTKQTIVKKWTTVANPQNLAQQQNQVFCWSRDSQCLRSWIQWFCTAPCPSRSRNRQ